MWIGLLAGCDAVGSPSPPPPPPPPLPPPPGGPCEYDDVAEPCQAHRVDVRDAAAGMLTVTYRGSRVYEMVTAEVRVAPDRIEEARAHYLSTPGTCEASVITRGSCPDVLHASVTPPPFPDP